MDVEETDKECTADNISDGDGQQIVDHEAAPADGGPLQYAEWNIEHIGNGVFESHSHECHHRPPDTEHFARKVMSRKSQPDGQTNQPVGTDSPKKRPLQNKEVEGRGVLRKKGASERGGSKE